MNRRCAICDPSTNYIDEILYCPEHGGAVSNFSSEDKCPCGNLLGCGHIYCTKCGEKIDPDEVTA